MSFQRIAFPEWLPDQPDLGNPGSTVATNVIPATNSYRPFPSSTSVSSALGARCQGAFSCTDSAGNTVAFAGTVDKLYIFNNSTSAWDDISRLAGGAYATEADAFWDFAKFGDFIIATNFIDDVQVYELGVSTNFAALAGSPPRARYVTVAGEQLFLGHLSTDPQGIAWSGIDDITTWAASQTTLADSQSLVGDGGHVTGIKGGDYVTVFQEYSIWRGTFVNVPLIWEFREVVHNRGCKVPASIIQVDTLIFFLADDGFYGWNGSVVLAVGKNKVDKTFYSSIDDDFLFRLCSSQDPINSLVMWAYPSGAQNGTPNRILVMNYSLRSMDGSLGRFSLVTGVEYEFLFPDLSKGYTLEQLDNINSSLDALPFSLDSRAWTGGNRLLAGFNTDHELVAFTSTYLAATLETAEVELGGSRRAFVQGVRPIADGGTLTVQLGTRELSTASVAYGSAISINTQGYCPARSSARKHRVRLNIAAAGTWSHAQGAEVEFTTDGYR